MKNPKTFKEVEEFLALMSRFPTTFKKVAPEPKSKTVLARRRRNKVARRSRRVNRIVKKSRKS